MSSPTSFSRDANTISGLNTSNIIACRREIIILITVLDFHNTLFVLIYCGERIRTMKISFKRHVYSPSSV